MVKSNSRMSNQSKIVKTYVKIKSYLNSNGLEVNAGKTTLTEYMVSQKRAKIGGQPPLLRVDEKVTENGGTYYREKFITDKNSTRLLGLNLQNNGTWDAHLASGKNLYCQHVGSC